MDFKKDLIESIKRLESTIDDLEYYTLHSMHYLDDYFDKIRYQIDIQREELLLKVNRFSDDVLKKVDEFYLQCKCNVSRMNINYYDSNKVKLKILNDDLQSKRKVINEISDQNDTAKLNEIRIKIDQSIIYNKIKIASYKNDILNEKIFFFDSVLFNLDSKPFGSLIVMDKRLKIDDETGKCIKSFSNNIGDELINNSYFDLCLEVLDNVYIAMGNNRGMIKIWNIQTSECISTIDAHKKSVFCLKKLLKGNLASGSRDFTIKIWNIKNKKCLDTLQGHCGPVISLCFIKDKNILISGSEDKKIKVWDIKQIAVCIKTLDDHAAMIIDLKLTDHNKLVSSSYDSMIKIWNLSNFKCENSITYNFYSQLHFELMSNNNIITLVKTKYVKIWDINDGKCLNTIYNIDSYNAIEIKLLSDDYLLIIYENNEKDDCNYRVFTYKIWNLNDGTCVKNFKGYYYEGSFYGLELLSNRKLIFCTDQFTRILRI
jgi:WD40 repeat protein